MTLETFPDYINYPNISVPYAEKILRREPPVLIERVSHGALVSHILKASKNPMGVFVSRKHVIGVELLPQVNQTHCIAAMNAIYSVGSGLAHTFATEETPGFRTKRLVVDGFTLDYEASLNGSANIGYFLSSIMLPTGPWFSASSLVNRLETLCESLGCSWVIFVDQRAETIRFKSLLPQGFNHVEPIPDLPTFLAAQPNPVPVSVAFYTLIDGSLPDSKHGWE